MSSGRSVGRTALIAAVLAIVGLVGTAVYATTTQRDFSLTASPTARSVVQGASAGYALTVTGAGGFKGTVSLSAGPVPKGATLGLSPTSVAISSTATSGSSTLTVATSGKTPAGSYTITMKGTSGGIAHRIDLTLTVSSPTAFTLSAAPSPVTVPAGSTAVYTVTISRAGSFIGAVALAGYGSRPTGTTTTFSPNPATGISSTMQVTTSARKTAVGTYTLQVSGSATVNGSAQQQYTQVQLVVTSASGSGVPFTISGNLPGTLAPGRPPLPLNLTLHNPNTTSLSVTNLTVTLSRITQSSSAPAGSTCGAIDYALMQYSGAYPLTVAAGQTATLSALGASDNWLPHLGMIDRPVSQDGCKGAVLTLTYSGSGQGN